MRFVNQSTFDDAGHTTGTVEVLGTGSISTTNFTQTLDDLPATMTAVNAVTGNQTTTWLYGTTLADSGVARNDLVRSVIYPDGTLGWSTLSSSDWSQMTANLWGTLPAGAATGNDATTTTYNRLGEPATFTDQRGTVHTFLSDLLGRPTHDCITTVGSNTDSAVLRISRAYEIRGMVATITSANNATPGAGTILNQVALSYNDFAQLQKDQQEHNGAVTSGTPSVQYAHDDGSSDSNQIRMNLLTYPNGRTIVPSYGTSGGVSDFLNRVEAINDTTSGTVTLASYLYLGLAVVVRITSPEPEIWLDLWGGVPGVFAGIDLFGRTIDPRWQNNIGGTPMDIDRFKYGHDRNSNRTWKANVVGTAAVTAGLDEFYLLDPLNRLNDMQRGVLNSTTAPTGITGTPSVEQDWTLDPVGNWSNFVTKAAGTVNLNQTRTANLVNEITNITETTGPTWVVPAHDEAGNTITMPKVSDPTQSLGAIYDAWQRQANISDDSGPVADYKYDGRNFRIVKDTYTSGVISETRHFFFTAAWQNVEERIGTSTTMDKQYVWGLGYVDKLICRDDATPQRLYACQDANFNLTSVVDASSGGVVERYLFDPYGLRTIMSALWSVISSSAYNWVIGPQGLMIDPESGLQSARNRISNAVMGAWLQRDDDYRDDLSLYIFEGNAPISQLDPRGRDYYSDSGFAGQISRQEFNELRAIIEQETGESGYGSGVDTVSALYAAQELGWDVSKLSAPEIYDFFREDQALESAMDDAFWASFFGDCKVKCLLAFLGLDALAAGTLIVGGLPTIKKRFVMKGTSKATSVWSTWIPKGPELPWNVWAPTVVRKLSTQKFAGRVLARWLPFVGWALLAIDSAKLACCLSKCGTANSPPTPAPPPSSPQFDLAPGDLGIAGIP